MLAVLSVTGCWYCFSSSCKDRLKSNITPIRMPIPGSFKNLKLCVKTISEDCRPSYLSKSYLLTFLGYKLRGFSSISNQFPRLVLSRFQNIKCPSFAANDNFCLSSKLISVQLHTCHRFYEKWLTRLWRFGLSVVRLKICLIWPKFVKLRQAIRTCKMFVMKENLSK